jgi:hypothetical protein
MGDDDSEQPDQGQGAAGGGSPYAEYLDRIPEDARSEAEAAFKQWDSDTTRKFQDAAEYRRNWEPFEQMGVQQRDPAEIEWAMQFVDALQNPTTIREWYDTYAQEHGLTSPDDQGGYQEFVDPSTQSALERMLQSQLGPVASQLAEISQWREAQELEAREAQAMAQIRSELDDLKSKHGADFNESMVEKLLPQYIESDPQHAVQRAWDDWQAIRNQIEQDTISGKANQPAGAVSGGTADGSPPEIRTLKDAAAAAIEQMRAGRTI